MTITIASNSAISLVDIQNEFGGANPIGLNEYYRAGTYVNTNQSTIPASGSAISFSDFPGKIKSAWFDTASTTSVQINTVKKDSSDNYYVGGYISLGSLYGAGILSKFNSAGGLVWSRRLLGANASSSLVTHYGVYLDASLNVFAFYPVYAETGQSQGSSDMGIAKYNNSGVLQWQRNFGNTTLQRLDGAGIDSSGNVFVWGTSGSLPQPMLLAKISTAGALLSVSILTNTVGGDTITLKRNVVFDSATNIYAAGFFANGVGGFIAKYSAGTTNLSTVYALSGTARPSCIVMDSSNNLYVMGQVTSGSYNTPGSFPGRFGFFILKMTSTGTILWARSLSDLAAGQACSPSAAGESGITLDSQNNVYFTGTYGSTNQGIVAKYSSAGVLQWQRIYKLASGASTATSGIILDSKSDIISGLNHAVFKGQSSTVTLAGTYGIWTIAAATLNDDIHSIASSVPTTFGQTTSSATPIATTFTDSAEPTTYSLTYVVGP